MDNCVGKKKLKTGSNFHFLFNVVSFNVSICILTLVVSLIQDAQNLKKMKRNSKIGKEIVAA